MQRSDLAVHDYLADGTTAVLSTTQGARIATRGVALEEERRAIVRDAPLIRIVAAEAAVVERSIVPVRDILLIETVKGRNVVAADMLIVKDMR